VINDLPGEIEFNRHGLDRDEVELERLIIRYKNCDCTADDLYDTALIMGFSEREVDERL
jgi:hypothetical protein